MKDLFSGHAEDYSRYRPGYPIELFDYLFSRVPTRKKAWDVGTGNGQVAAELANRFEEVHATDISDQQLFLAPERPNLHYHVCPANETPFGDQEFDLITVGQALHWFDFGPFFSEVRRVAKNGALFAAWGYRLLHIDQKIDDQLYQFYRYEMEGYWEAERTYVDDGYRSIPIPFEMLPDQRFEIEVIWNLEDLGHYLRTWSSVQKYMQLNKADPVEPLLKNLQEIWGEPKNSHLVVFPVFLRAGFVRK